MKCPNCNGKGKVLDYVAERNCHGEWETVLREIPCDKCQRKPMTNEEWFCGLSTEEKAKVLRRKTYGNGEDNEREEQGWVSWLQAKHEDNPPDIPSVPSWDKWLQGEKTKCEYCDGTNAECNLVGRFECPKTPKTEQEYLQTCTTEQLAEEIYGFVWCCNELWQRLCCSGDGTDKESDLKIVRKWLKQPHTPKE